MKIAQIDVNYQSSSTGKIVSDLVSCFRENGHSTLACYGRGESQFVKNVYKISGNTEILFHVFATRLTGFTGCYSPYATTRLIRLLDEYQPDIVHLHDLHGYFLNIEKIVSYLKSKKIPTVWTFHSEFMYTGKCGHAFECDKWQTQCNNCPSLHEYPKSWFFDFTKEMFEGKKRMFHDFPRLHLTAPSEWLANRMELSPILGHHSISIIQNGIDVDVFYPRKSNDLFKRLSFAGKFVVVSVGSNLLSDAKGGQWVLELAQRNPDISFIMVGVESPPRVAPNNVTIFPQILNQNVLAEYYSMADLLLLTSKKETFSMICAESLACGTPVIGFDSGAPKEVAPPGFGKFVTYGDIEGLELLLREFKDGKVKMKSPQECREFAVKKYSKMHMAESFEKTYHKMMES
jgi:putative colanic acid biosynthesis glycosyltransferase